MDAHRHTETALVRGEGLTAWRQIADALTADIAAGRVVPGEAVEAWVSESVRLGRPTERPRSERHPASRAG